MKTIFSGDLPLPKFLPLIEITVEVPSKADALARMHGVKDDIGQRFQSQVLRATFTHVLAYVASRLSAKQGSARSTLRCVLLVAPSTAEILKITGGSARKTSELRELDGTEEAGDEKMSDTFAVPSICGIMNDIIPCFCEIRGIGLVENGCPLTRPVVSVVDPTLASMKTDAVHAHDDVPHTNASTALLLLCKLAFIIGDDICDGDDS